jgi:hypothetical protein
VNGVDESIAMMRTRAAHQRSIDIEKHQRGMHRYLHDTGCC